MGRPSTSTSDSVELQSLTGRKFGKSEEPAQLGEHDRVSYETSRYQDICGWIVHVCIQPDTLRELPAIDMVVQLQIYYF